MSTGALRVRPAEYQFRRPPSPRVGHDAKHDQTGKEDGNGKVHVPAGAPDHARQASPQNGQGFHEAFFPSDRKRIMIAVVCSHFPVSRSNCLRPARVSE